MTERTSSPNSRCVRTCAITCAVAIVVVLVVVVAVVTVMVIVRVIAKDGKTTKMKWTRKCTVANAIAVGDIFSNRLYGIGWVFAYPILSLLNKKEKGF